MHLMIFQVLECNQQQAQQLAGQMQKNSSGISFGELWKAIQQDRPQGMTDMMRNFVRLAGQGPQGGGMGMQGGMNGGGGGTLLLL